MVRSVEAVCSRCDHPRASVEALVHGVGVVSENSNEPIPTPESRDGPQDQMKVTSTQPKPSGRASEKSVWFPRQPGLARAPRPRFSRSREILAALPAMQGYIGTLFVIFVVLGHGTRFRSPICVWAWAALCP